MSRIRSTGKADILLFATLRNEMPRLAYFLEYYRKLGVNHFCFVDNESRDGGREYLASQPDCSVWRSAGSYRSANFGMAWLNYLLNRHARGRWVLVTDPDEFLVYAHCDTRPLAALTEWLDSQGQRSFGAMLIDMYPRGAIENTTFRDGENPFARLEWFDSANYSYRKSARMQSVWILGGPRQRKFFAANPQHAPALNKTPLVHWQRGYVYTSSTHELLPRALNQTYCPLGGEKACGALLHAKLTGALQHKAAEELERREHFSSGREYRAYLKKMRGETSFWSEHSVRFRDWKTLEDVGLMSAGGWF